MATADELLAMMAEDGTVYDDDICFADQDTRTVAIPERLKIIGVENDDDVAVRRFRVPAICCGTDLSAFEIRVNFENAKKERDCYFVTDAVVDGDCIVFSWRVDRVALRYKGRLRFAIHMELLDADGFIEKEWNSAPAHFDVLEGLEVELTGKEEEAARAAATQLVRLLEKEGENQIAAVEAAGAETIASIPEDYAALSADAVKLSNGINALQDYTWIGGYVPANGQLSDDARTRKYSPLLVCPPCTEIAYVAETNHANICGISFYDLAGTFISGVTNNGEIGTEVTVVSPEKTAFCRLSTTRDILAQSYYKPAVNILTHMRRVYNDVCYVDCDNGSDQNDGTTEALAFATIQAAINSGAKRIVVKEGTYTSGINLTNANGVQITPNKKYSRFDAETAASNPKVIIDCAGNLSTGVVINKCTDCRFEGIEVVNAAASGWAVSDSTGLAFFDCVAHGCAVHGFGISDTNAEFVRCAAYDIGVMGGGNHNDGFNIHGTGTTNFVNCSAWNCEDDGVSHHDACHGYICGGEYYNCCKGGVSSPTHGATVDVIGVYSHDNGYGVYAASTQGRSGGIIRDCVLKDNTAADVYIVNADIKLLKTIYDKKQVDSTATVVEIS